VALPLPPPILSWKNASGLASLTTSDIWNQVKIPKGFENFFPKNKQPDDPAAAAAAGAEQDKPSEKEDEKKANDNESKDTDPPKVEETKSKEDVFGNFGKKAGGGSGGGSTPPPGGDQQQQLGGVLAMAAILFILGFVLSDDSNDGGREVTWSEFRNHMLEPGDVDRIVVTNKNTARVYLRPGARGVPRHPIQQSIASGQYGVMQSKRRMGTSAKRKNDDNQNDEFFDQGSSMDFGSAADSGDSSPSRGVPGIPSQHQLVYNFTIGSVESFERKLEDAQREIGMSPRDYVPVQYSSETSWGAEVLKIVPTLMLIGILFYGMRNMGGGGAGGGGGMGGIFKIGKSNAKKIKKEDIDVTFADVAGCQEAKKEIVEFVDFLKDASRFTKLGAKIPKGALLCGPPGTGKTLLAKAVAGEANVPFFSISGSDFIEMFVGVGPSRVRDLFKEARAAAPSIIFIDEIDAVGRQRGRGGFSGGNDERENTLNQLLVEMDGFNPSSGVVVLAGTNRADILDQALTRPGRFDRQIQVDLPDLQGRKEIFGVHLRGIKLELKPEEVSGRLAGLTPGMAGADIANLCNEAAIQAARREAESVTMADFEKATDRVIGGLESNKMISQEEKRIVAHHEAGHAVAGWFLEHADPLLKVTIVPRSSGALGFAQYLPREVFLRTQDQIMDTVCMALAGRAAEEIMFGNVTTGASDDLKRVTQMVYSTIQVYGMNKRVGQVAFPKDQNAMGGESKPYSDATAQVIDEEAKKVVDAAYQRTLDLLRDKKEDLMKVAELLIEKETITHDDVLSLIGERPFKGDKTYDDFIMARKETVIVDSDSDADADKESSEPNEGDNDNTGQVTPGVL